MPIARVVDGRIEQERSDIVLTDVPEHKRASWLPIEGEMPHPNPDFYEVSGPVYQIESNRVLRVWTITARSDLDDVKANSKAKISREAERERGRHITLGSGKAMSYQQVASEAVRYVATNGAGAYPFLQARVDSGRYPDLATAATGTLAIEQQWATIGAAIDCVEDKAKLEIDAATTVEQVQAAASVVWP